MNSLPSLNPVPMETIDSWETVNSQVEQLPSSPHQSRFSPLNEADKSEDDPIKEFQQIIFEETGESITYEQALADSTALLNGLKCLGSELIQKRSIDTKGSK